MYTTGSQLLKEIRGELVAQGTSLNAFCQAHNYERTAVTKALNGQRTGPKSRSLAEEFVKSVRRAK